MSPSKIRAFEDIVREIQVGMSPPAGGDNYHINRHLPDIAKRCGWPTGEKTILHVLERLTMSDLVALMMDRSRIGVSEDIAEAMGDVS